MKKTKRIAAIAVFYVIAIALRYLTNKTSILSGLESAFLRTILQGMGPAVRRTLQRQHLVLRTDHAFPGLFAFTPRHPSWIPKGPGGVAKCKIWFHTLTITF